MPQYTTLPLALANHRRAPTVGIPRVSSPLASSTSFAPPTEHEWLVGPAMLIAVPRMSPPCAFTTSPISFPKREEFSPSKRTTIASPPWPRKLSFAGVPPEADEVTTVPRHQPARSLVDVAACIRLSISEDDQIKSTVLSARQLLAASRCREPGAGFEIAYLSKGI
jgi:hypothetical protein